MSLGLVVVGLAVGVTIFLRLEAQRPFAEFHSPVLALATAQLNGRTVLVSAHLNGTILVSDLATGDPVGHPIFGSYDDEFVDALATSELDGRPVIISGSGDHIRVWDMAAGTPIGQPLPSQYVRMLTTAELDGRPVVISSGRGVRVWDLATGALLHDYPEARGPVTTAQLDGRTVIISGGRDADVWVWDLATGSRVAHHDHPDLDGHVLAVAQLNGRTVVVSNDYSGGFRVWDLATGELIGRPVHWPEADPRTDWLVENVATAVLEDGRPVVISSGGDYGMVRVWDLATSTPIGDPLDRNSDIVSPLATAQLDGRIVIISADRGIVRIWDLARVHP